MIVFYVLAGLAIASMAFGFGYVYGYGDGIKDGQK